MSIPVEFFFSYVVFRLSILGCSYVELSKVQMFANKNR